ncbi:unnamed protein product, partial [Ectocarpus sp. 12 AP-2014]
AGGGGFSVGGGRPRVACRGFSKPSGVESLPAVVYRLVCLCRGRGIRWWRAGREAGGRPLQRRPGRSTCKNRRHIGSRRGRAAAATAAAAAAAAEREPANRH